MAAEKRPEFYIPFQELQGQAKKLSDFMPARAFDGRIPLGVDFRDALSLATLALDDATQMNRELLGEWRDKWLATDGRIDGISVDRRNDEFRTDLVIIGPADLTQDTPAYPALNIAFAQEFGGKKMVTDIHVGLGFVGEDNKPLPARWDGFDILNLDFDAAEGVAARTDFWKFTGATVLAERALHVVSAAGDPLNGAIRQINSGLLQYTDIMADPTAEFKWQRPSRTPADAQAVEVCFLEVDSRYGDDRFVVLVRDSTKPDDIILTFNNDEWDAFAGGAKDGEFDNN